MDPDDRLTVDDLAAVGATFIGWRAGPLEDWHSQPDSRISDPELVRASVGMTRLVRDVLATGAPQTVFDMLAGLLGDLDRRLPDRRTLVEIAPTSDEARAHVRYVEAAVRRWEQLAADVGHGATMSILACAAARRSRHWWGTPWWPRRVEAFLGVLGGRTRANFQVDHGIGLDVLRAKLLDGPDRMAPGLVAACLRAGIGDLSLRSEPLVSRRFALFTSLVDPETPQEKYRRLLVELHGGRRRRD